MKIRRIRNQRKEKKTKKNEVYQKNVKERKKQDHELLT